MTAPQSPLEVELAAVARRRHPCCTDAAPGPDGLRCCPQHRSEARRVALAGRPIQGAGRGSGRK